MHKFTALFWGLLFGLFCFNTLNADEVRPGYLELREITPTTWDVLWKVPAINDKYLAIYADFPSHCIESDPFARFVGGSYIKRWKIACDGSLFGETLYIDGLSKTQTDVLVRILRSNNSTQTELLTPRESAFVMKKREHWSQVALTYANLGVDHILLGFDHLLFVLALLFLVKNWSRLIGTITEFTLAHSLTLIAATLGWVTVPQAPVEAVIALSIAFIATEILHSKQGKSSLAMRKPWAVAFVFGFLHGLGFAGALNEIGLPQTAIPIALAFFNIGVEVGQLIFVGMVFIIFMVARWALFRNQSRLQSTWLMADIFAIPVSYVIGTLAMFWIFERTLAFWS